MNTPLGKLGVWSFVDNLAAPQAANFARQVEAWGYGALWLPEAVGRDPFSTIGYLAANTEKLVFSTGIANIYARDAMTMNAIRQTLGELAPGRFVMGLGVSHSHLVSNVRGHEYKKPVTTMRNYLQSMDKSLYMAAKGDSETPLVIAALRQNMLKLAADQTFGAHPYFVPPEHTAWAREIMGSDAWLCPEQMVLLESDPAVARAAARKHMSVYLGLPNYQNCLRQFGYGDEDFADNGSDRLVDAIVAWGDEDALRARIQAHWQAGASHVCIQPLPVSGEAGQDMKVLELLAPVND